MGISKRPMLKKILFEPTSKARNKRVKKIDKNTINQPWGSNHIKKNRFIKKKEGKDKTRRKKFVYLEESQSLSKGSN